MASDFLVDGGRIMAMRRARGLSRRILANLVGCSEEWLRLVEKGARPLDRLSTIMRIADVLRVNDLSELIGGHITLPATGDHGECDDVGRALLFPRLCADGVTESVHRVHRHVSSAWEIWRRSPRRYTELRRRLPALLLMADTSAEHAKAEDRQAAAADLTDVYRLFATLLRGCGHHPLALLAADRAVAAAPADLRALTRAELAEVLIHLGRYADARRLCLAATELTDDPSTIGTCYLTAALATAEENDLLRTEELLNRARKLGGRLGVDFMAEVDLHAVVVAARMGRYRQAIRLAADVDADRLYAKDRQARYFLSLATAYAMDRNPEAATAMLRKVAETCPEELKYSPQAGRVVDQLRRLDCETTRGELRQIARLTA
ncbi:MULTISPECIES: helix-turn-helix transcriptional regulator [unclassified Nonomuraea]|uniref:helix-turn-helix domain-containing protein n=1 Tax=unclassified Nonomuraea TaxID=2593643 RepID=UPI0033F20710